MSGVGEVHVRFSHCICNWTSGDRYFSHEHDSPLLNWDFFVAFFTKIFFR